MSSPFIPDEITTLILKNLQVKSLLRFQAVCKSWQGIIKSRDFGRRHFEYHSSSRSNSRKKILLKIVKTHKKYPGMPCYCCSFDPSIGIGDGHLRIISPFTTEMGLLSFVSSCDGMVLSTRHPIQKSVSLWNPTTGKLATVQAPYGAGAAFGFGYDTSIQGYKIVAACLTEAQIFSFESNSWRNIQIPDQFSIKDCHQAGVFYDGAIHFVARKLNQGGEWKGCALSLNLADEVFDEILTLPVAAILMAHWEFSLRLRFKSLGGELCLQYWDDHRFHLWSLNDLSKSFWTEIASSVYSFSDEKLEGFEPLCAILDVHTFIGWKDDQLFMADVERKALRKLTNVNHHDGECLHFVAAMVYLESLVSPPETIDLSDS